MPIEDWAYHEEKPGFPLYASVAAMKTEALIRKDELVQGMTVLAPTLHGWVEAKVRGTNLESDYYIWPYDYDAEDDCYRVCACINKACLKHIEVKVKIK